MTCPPNCPRRSIYCHSTCGTYLRERVKRLLQYRANARAAKQAAFDHDIRRSIIRLHGQMHKSK